MTDADGIVAELVKLHGTDHAPTEDQWRQFLSDDDGGPVLMNYLVKFRDQAVYPDGVDEPPRSGRDAFFLAGQSLAEVIKDVGGTPIMGGFPSQSMVDADEHEWDYAGAAKYPSRQAFIDSWLDERAVAAGVHRRAGTVRHRLHVTRPLYP